MAKPKLALIPSAQGSKFYSVLPSSGVGDFDFSRSGSATRINSQGLIETVGNGVSRLNYPMIDGVVSGCPHHILEPQRTNLIQYSEDFSNSAWNKDNTTITSNQVISPDGTLSADLLTANDGSHINAYTGIPTSNNNYYSYSVFLKKGNTNIIQPYIFEVGIGFKTISTINFDNETATTTVGNISLEKYSNDWFKVSITLDLTSAYGFTFGIFTESTLGIKTVYAWGAQLEQGSYSTSYIPTNGSTVTRSSETANGSGDAATFNSEQGVLMWEGSTLDDSTSGSVRRLSLSNGTNDNRIQILFSNTVGRIGVIAKSGGLFQIDTGFLGYNTIDSNKIAVRYGSGVFKVYINGLSVFNDAGVSFSSISLDDLRFSNPFGTETLESKTKQIQYFDTALTDNELETLTSWVSFQDMAEGQLYTIE